MEMLIGFLFSFYSLQAFMVIILLLADCGTKYLFKTKKQLILHLIPFFHIFLLIKMVIKAFKSLE